jgi:ribosomal protein S18 acetylase RimI-like enzyme
MVYSTFSGNVLIRAMEIADIPWLMAFQETAVPFLGGKEIPWTEAQWRTHFEVFPEGQLVALLDEQIVGFAASLLLRAGSNPYRIHTFEGVTEGGWFLNHEVEGESLFVADIRVEPDGRGEEWAGALHEALRDLGHVRNCQRILAAVCLGRFKETTKDPVAVDYGKKILAGEIKDPILFFHLRQGFVVRSLMPHYRPMSKNQGIMGLVEWVNPGHEMKTKSLVVRVASVPFKVQRIGSFEEFAGQVAYFVETAAGYESDFVVFPEFFFRAVAVHDG